MGRLLNENNVYALFAPNGTARLHVADIDVLPRVDAVEVVHGRWIDVRQYCGDYMCSNCKELSRTKTYNYCPGCGAKMDSEDKK